MRWLVRGFALCGQHQRISPAETSGKVFLLLARVYPRKSYKDSSTRREMDSIMRRCLLSWRKHIRKKSPTGAGQGWNRSGWKGWEVVWVRWNWPTTPGEFIFQLFGWICFLLQLIFPKVRIVGSRGSGRGYPGQDCNIFSESSHKDRSTLHTVSICSWMFAGQRMYMMHMLLLPFLPITALIIQVTFEFYSSEH